MIRNANHSRPFAYSFSSTSSNESQKSKNTIPLAPMLHTRYLSFIVHTLEKNLLYLGSHNLVCTNLRQINGRGSKWVSQKRNETKPLHHTDPEGSFSHLLNATRGSLPALSSLSSTTPPLLVTGAGSSLCFKFSSKAL